MKKGISLVINVKNEEKNIKGCIDSAKGIVDEIIVVDMQSTDKTVEIAKKLGAKVFSVPDYGYADPARNFAHSKASFEWILSLDADERLNSNLRGIIKKAVASNKYDVIYFPFKNIHFGKWIKHTGWWPDYHPRLFRKGKVNWHVGAAHFPLETKGREYKFLPSEKNAVIHFNTKEVSQMLEKINRYTNYSISFKDIKDPTGPFILSFIESEFWDRYLTREGYKDSMHGYVLSKFMEYYRFLEFVKYWEKTGYKELGDMDKMYEILKERREELKEIREKLNQITSSNFFKLWRIYVPLKEKFLKVLGKNK